MPPLLSEQLSNFPYNSEVSKENECVSRIKCVLVGDGAIGKTSLIIGYTTNAFPKEYRPTAYDKYSVTVNVNSQPIRLQICDTAGQDDFDALRPLCYPHTDVFLLCFSVVYPTSFYNIAEKWIYEVRHHCPKVPIVLVGTQSDLRTDINVLVELADYREQPISVHQAEVLAARIGAVAYIECSAVTQRNLKEVFDTALLAALKARKPELMFAKKSEDVPTSSWKLSSNQGYVSCDRKKSKRGWRKLCCLN